MGQVLSPISGFHFLPVENFQHLSHNYESIGTATVWKVSYFEWEIKKMSADTNFALSPALWDVSRAPEKKPRSASGVR